MKTAKNVRCTASSTRAAVLALRPFDREIGIGQATVIDEIILGSPASGITQVIKNVKPNQLKLKKARKVLRWRK